MRRLALLLVPLLGGATLAPAGGAAEFRPLLWEPVLTAFYPDYFRPAAPPESRDLPAPHPLRETAEAWRTWKTLKEEIRIRETNGIPSAYGEKEDVPAYWRWTSRASGSFLHEQYRATRYDECFALYAKSEGGIYFVLELDVLMSEPWEKKEELVAKRFRLLELLVTAEGMKPPDLEFRKALGGSGQRSATQELLRWGGPGERVGLPLDEAREKLRGMRPPLLRFSAPDKQNNVIEFRVFARVSGSVDEFDSPEVKTLSAATRIFFVDLWSRGEVERVYRSGKPPCFRYAFEEDTKESGK